MKSSTEHYINRVIHCVLYRHITTIDTEKNAANILIAMLTYIYYNIFGYYMYEYYNNVHYKPANKRTRLVLTKKHDRAQRRSFKSRDLFGSIHHGAVSAP